MNQPVNSPHPGRSARRRRCADRAPAALLGLLVLPLAFSAGCDSEVQKEFRAAAVESIETGVNAIVDGVLDGLFAIAEPNEEEGETGGS